MHEVRRTETGCAVAELGELGSHTALPLHRDALVEHGLPSPGHDTILRRPSHHPNSRVGAAQMGHLRAVCHGESPPDAHTLLLLDLVKAPSRVNGTIRG